MKTAGGHFVLPVVKTEVSSHYYCEDQYEEVTKINVTDSEGYAVMLLLLAECIDEKDFTIPNDRVDHSVFVFKILNSDEKREVEKCTDISDTSLDGNLGNVG